MGLIDIIFGVLALVVSYVFWVWRKDGQSLRPFLGRLVLWIRSTIDAVSRDEMRMLGQHVKEMEQQWETRLNKLERTAQLSSQVPHVSKETDQQQTGFAKPKSFELLGESKAASRPRSIIRFGLRLTVGDALWTHLGIHQIDTVGDRMIETMLQGPFCPVCLKRVVARNRMNAPDAIPPHCRHCGVSWGSQWSVDMGSSLLTMKRQVYAQLDQEYRANGIIQPEV